MEVVLDGQKIRLLDQVSGISSVSGGSFTSAYYGLYGDRIFEDFEDRFLRANIDARHAIDLLRPLKLARRMLTPYSRSDMAMDVYDEYLFDGATFADLAAANGPLLAINATDLDVGAVFTFFQPDFDLICGDLSKLRVSTAVTASSAVPGIFASILLKNRAGSCGLPEPEWIEEAMATPRASRRRYHEARTAATYLDRTSRPYVFLVDGGIADNTGARRIIAEVIEAGGISDLAQETDVELPEKILYIVVNSQAGGRHDWDKSASLPSISTVLGTITGAGVYRYNFETVELLREGSAQWAKTARDHGHELETYVAEIAFDDLPDAAERAYFNAVETSFNLPDEQVDRLIEVGGRLLRATPEFQQFLNDLD